MSAMTGASFASPRNETRALNRAVTWSLVIHLTVVLAIFLVPHDWLSQPHAKPKLMNITLGGSEGPKTSGMAAMSSRTVEKVAPPEKRPEPPRPTPKVDPTPAAAVIRTPPKADPTPQVATIKPSSAATRPPVTGARIVSGTAAVETNSRSQSVGLATSTGGAGGGEADIMNFCCPEYITQMLNTIDGNWKKDQVERGSSTLKFTIYRDGSIHDIVVEKPSGSGILDRNAKSALLESRLLKLPAEYTRPTLTIHLTFPNGV